MRVGSGERLTTQEIANQLDVSLIPVREALQLLQSEGLVETALTSGASGPDLRLFCGRGFHAVGGLEVVASAGRRAADEPEETDDLEALIGEMDVVIEGVSTSAGGSSTRGCTYPADTRGCPRCER